MCVQICKEVWNKTLMLFIFTVVLQIFLLCYSTRKFCIFALLVCLTCCKVRVQLVQSHLESKVNIVKYGWAIVCLSLWLKNQGAKWLRSCILIKELRDFFPLKQKIRVSLGFCSLEVCMCVTWNFDYLIPL